MAKSESILREKKKKMKNYFRKDFEIYYQMTEVR